MGVLSVVALLTSSLSWSGVAIQPMLNLPLKSATPELLGR